MNKEQKLIILASIIGLSLMMMNVIVVAIAIPQITSSIPFTSISSHWIINIYALAMAVAGTVVGKISDIILSRNIIIIGFIVFAISSIGCIYSETYYYFLLFRFTQGLSCLMINIPAFKLLTELFTKESLGKALGIVTGSAAIIAAIIPIAAGMVIQLFSWKGFFFMNIPLCIFSILILMTIKQNKLTNKSLSFDFIGFIFLTAFLVTFIFSIMEWSHIAAISIVTLFALSLVFILIFFLIEKYNKHPIVSLDIFQNKIFSLSLLISSLTHAHSLTSVFWIIYMQKVLFYNSFQSGLLFSPFYICFAISGFLSGKLLNPEKPKIPLLFGVLITFAGYFLTVLLLPLQSYISILPVMTLAGLGFCFILNPIRVIVMHSIPPEQRGVAIGLMNNFRHIVSVIMFSFFSGIISFFSVDNHFNKSIENYSNNFSEGFFWVMAISGLISFSCVILSIKIVRIVMKKIF